MIVKHRYDRNVKNSNKWADQPQVNVKSAITMKTLNSVDHNILTHRENLRTKPIETSIFSKPNATNNRQKSITEYCDFERPTAVRHNFDHAVAIAKASALMLRNDVFIVIFPLKIYFY